MIKKAKKQRDIEPIIEEKDSSAAVDLGQILQQKRQSLKIEISAVSSYLKIKSRDVEAIERGDLKSITKHLYILGLIRSYAAFLKINREVIEEKIKFLSFKSNVQNKDHQLLNIGEQTKLMPNRDVFFNFILISILLFLVLLSLYGSYKNNGAMITNQSLINELEKIDS
jgi:cytoskeletal protein RodZ